MKIKEFLEDTKLYTIRNSIHKSGNKVVLYTENLDEDKVIERIHECGYLCIPHKIPTNGYFTIERK